MGKNTDADSTEELQVSVDEQGQIRVPEKVLNQLEINPPEEVPAMLIGSILRVGSLCHP